MTMTQLEWHSEGDQRHPGDGRSCAPSVEANRNDARWLREKQGKEKLLAEVVRRRRCASAGRPEHGLSPYAHPAWANST